MNGSVEPSLLSIDTKPGQSSVQSKATTVPAAESTPGTKTSTLSTSTSQSPGLVTIGQGQVTSNECDLPIRTRIGSLSNGSNANRISPPRTPFLIGVAGGTASGKSTVCSKIMDKLGQDMDRYHQRVVCISQDSFYRELKEEEREEALRGNYNFDHPDALDHELIKEILTDVLNEKQVQIPTYDFANMRKTEEYKTVYPADVVLFEGILVFYYPEIRELFHMKLFVDTDPDTRLARRVLRDVQERGRDLEFVLGQYTNFVKPAFEDFCLPTKKYADVIIPRGADNEVAIDLIMKHVETLLSLYSRRYSSPITIPSPNPFTQAFASHARPTAQVSPSLAVRRPPSRHSSPSSVPLQATSTSPVVAPKGLSPKLANGQQLTENPEMNEQSLLMTVAN